jgi:hypothetical protein
LARFFASFVHALSNFWIVVCDRLADGDETLHRQVDSLADSRHRRGTQGADGTMLLNEGRNLEGRKKD